MSFRSTDYIRLCKLTRKERREINRIVRRQKRLWVGMLTSVLKTTA